MNCNMKGLISLGFYDEGYENQNNRKRNNKKGYFFSSLIGAVIGALLMILALPILNDMGIVSVNNDEQVVENNSDSQKDAIKTRNVSVNVDTDITKAVEKAADAVVGVTNIQSRQSFWFDSADEEEEAGSGSGVIYKKSGDKAYIVTNHHVIDGAQSIEVTLSDGTKLPATLRGSDVWTDLAVLEVDGKKIKTVADFGDSDTLKSGEPVIAIGDPLGSTFSGSVTQGIISGLERAIPVDINNDGTADWQAEVIQTDAAINPGNSGGALINVAGQVIGINSMKIAENAVEGIGLAIPINYAIPVIEDLERDGKVVRPYMGVELQSVNEIPSYYQQEALKLPKDVNYGVAIRRVEPNSPADKAGLKEYDVIVEMDGEKIEDVIALRKHLYTKKSVGDTMKVKFYRDGKLKTVTMKLDAENSL